VAALFDSNGDGKADLVACPPGWGCELVIEHQMDSYELHDTVETTKAQYAASMADAMARYEQGEPILFYTWTPNWTVGMLKPGEDVVWIEVPFANLPEEQKAFEDQTTVAGVQGCVADPCQTGWPANDIRPVVSSEFLEENPAAARLFEVMSIPLEDIFAQNAKMFEGEDDEEDIEAHAAQWIQDNREQVDGWLEEARAAAS
jgi:glycine betaine/proline transport system substrate-binding protein